MRNKDKWVESKYCMKDGRLCASENDSEVYGGSWLNAQLLADTYNEWIPKYVRGNLLDLGCGKVPLYTLYKDYVSESFCVDWGNSMHGNEYLDLQTDISQKLPFEDNNFQTVICSDVLEHVYNPQDVLNEIIRVTKPGGYILISTPFNYWMHEIPYDYYRYTTYFYEKFAEKNEKVEIECIKQMGGMWAVMGDLVGKKIARKSQKIARVIQKAFYNVWNRKDIKESAFTLEIGVVYKKL